MNDLIIKLVNYCRDSHNIDLCVYDDDYLLKTISKRLIETNSPNEMAYYNFITNHTEELNVLIKKIHNGYTEFFRNSLSFATLEHIIIPDLINTKAAKGGKEIRIWSAACASGEEAYSAAILLEEILKKTEKELNYRIFASDIDKTQIDIAKKGEYHKNTINNVNIRLLNKWFEEKGNSYKIKKEIKNKIDFSVFDVFSKSGNCPPASIFGEFDVIFCANILFYYNNKYYPIVFKKIAKTLSNSGVVVTGEAERDFFLSENFIEIVHSSCIFKRKGKKN